MKKIKMRWFTKLPHFLTRILLLLILGHICQHRFYNQIVASCFNDQDKIENIFALKTNSSYWKWVKPPGGLTEVTVSMQINRIAIYNDAESTLDVQILFELEWLDERLRFNETDCKTGNGETNFTIEGNEWHYSKIWSPSLRLARSKKPAVLNSKALSHVMILRISYAGYVTVRMRSNVNLYCPMDYRKYPFDSQTCRISLVSNDLSTDKLRLLWKPNEELIIDDNLQISSHSLESYSLSNSDQMLKKEKFSSLIVDIHLKRQWGHYMLVIFFPSMLIVATSWLSFWVEITSPPARIMLCVTTLLALVTVSKEVQQDLPKLPYIKATDLWFAGCTVSIFLSLIEYVIVAYTFRAESKKYKERKKMKRSLSSMSLSSNETQAKFDSPSLLIPESDRFGRRSNVATGRSPLSAPLPSSNHSQFPPRIHFTFSPPDSPNLLTPSPTEYEIGELLKDTPQEVAESIDRKSRILFPFMFILFNLIYWTHYN